MLQPLVQLTVAGLNEFFQLTNRYWFSDNSVQVLHDTS